MPRGALKNMQVCLQETSCLPNSLQFQFFSSLTTEGIIGKVTMTDFFVLYSSDFHVLGLIKQTLTTIYNSKCLTDPV